MLRSIRKFSSSIYAKIFLGIVAIPFIFWGMGSSFTSGSKNVLVQIDKEKISTQDFANFIRSYRPNDQKISSDDIDKLLPIFIGNKLIEKEFEYFEIKLSDKSLKNLIIIQKEFKRENIFSRTEYEKFLLTNNFKAVKFEKILAKQEKKKQFLNFISGGILPPKYLVNATYNKINQKRNIELINLNDIFANELNFSEDQIQSYYENNEETFKEIYKTVKILELNPKNLIGSNEFNNIFFKKIDDIYDSIIQGQNFDDILKEYNLKNENTFIFNESGEDINSKVIDNLPKSIIKNTFALIDSEPTTLIETKEKFFILEIIKTENIQKKIKNENVKKNIIFKLKLEKKIKLMSEIISKINQKKFIKSDFDKLSNDKNISIKKITLNSQNDNKTLKKELVDQIYSFPEKQIVVVHDIKMNENFLIYIDKIKNVSIDETSEEYKKYIILSEKEIANRLFNTYDNYIKEKYMIDINYKALKTVKNYFN